MKRVAVLGGGNGAFAMASDLALSGFEVGMWSKYSDELSEIRKTHRIRVSGPLIQGEARIERITDKIEEVVGDADLICAPVPAFTQISLAESLLPYLEDGKVIFLSPGSFGSCLMYKYFRERGCKKDIAIGETGTLPYLNEKDQRSRVQNSDKSLPFAHGCFPCPKDRRGDCENQNLFPIGPSRRRCSIRLPS